MGIESLKLRALFAKMIIKIMILPFKLEKITIRIVGLSVITFKFKIGEQSGPSKLKRYMSAMRTIQSLTAGGLNAMGVSNLSTHLFFSNV